MRKAQGISINVIIMIVLGLLVLVVLASVMAQRFGWFARDTILCEKQGGICADRCGFGAAFEKPIEFSAQCENEAQICCIG